jgi:hypothetical protein
MEWLRSYRPDLVEHYERLYARGAYLPQAERRRLSALLAAGRPPRMGPFRRDPADTRPINRGRRMPVEPPRGAPDARAGQARPAPPATVQEALF